MDKLIKGYPRLYSERSAPEPLLDNQTAASLTQTCRAFERATGWPLQYARNAGPCPELDLRLSAPVDPGVGAPPGRARIELGGTVAQGHNAPIDREAARDLADGFDRLLADLTRTQFALWQREADLAAGVPLAPHRDGERHLARRLAAVLKGGAEAVSCSAAALYLLNEATSELKLRSSWRIPLERYTAPARPLASAPADLEVLAGHAVVVSDATREPQWGCPEPFASAICVPVSSPTVVLGTLWLFCDRRRSFADEHVNVAEIVAGRLAADLEREMLLAEGILGAQLKRQWAAAEQVQQNQLPRIAPISQQWEIAGFTEQGQGLGGDFFDWMVQPDESLIVAVGTSPGGGLAAALGASTLRAALRAQAQHAADPATLLERLNRDLWTGSSGDQVAGLFLANLQARGGRLLHAATATCRATVVRDGACRRLESTALTLGTDPDAKYEGAALDMRPGDFLVVESDGAKASTEQASRPGVAEYLASDLARSSNVPAEQLIRLARAQWHVPKAENRDRTLLIVRRR